MTSDQERRHPVSSFSSNKGSGPSRNAGTAVGLVVILALQAVFGVLYAIQTPPWQAPDEPAHFNYVRVLAESGALPVLQSGDYDQEYLERIKAEKFPPALSIEPLRYEAHQPPLYYLLVTPLYLGARALNFDAARVLRLFSVVLAFVLSLIAFGVLCEVFPHQPLLQLAALGMMATLPMHLAMSAAINNDTLAEIVVALILWVSIRRVTGKMSTGHFIRLGGIFYGIALLTKTTIYSSALLLAVAEIGHWWMKRRNGAFARVEQSLAHEDGRAESDRAAAKACHPLQLVVSLLLLFGLALALGGGWFIRNALTYGWNDVLAWGRHDAVVVGQPTTAEWIARYGWPRVVFDFVVISFKSFWAQFGWMGVLVHERLYVLLMLLTAFAALGALLWSMRLVRERGSFSPQMRWTWLLLALLLVLVSTAHASYNVKFIQPQGRYLFPALIPIAAFGTAGLNELIDARYARVLFGLLYLGLLLLDYIALYWYIVPQLTR